MYPTMTTGQAAATNVIFSNATLAPAPITLARAVAQADDLNKRLAQLSASIEGIARTIGGPFPASGAETSKDRPVAASVIADLNDKISRAHISVNEIENAIMAINASLGA